MTALPTWQEQLRALDPVVDNLVESWRPDGATEAEIQDMTKLALSMLASGYLCHVYSDASLDELWAWGRQHGLKRAWVDRKHVLPHYDVRADLVAAHEPGVGRAELVADIRAWRARERP